MSDKDLPSIPREGGFDKISKWYEQQTWLRAVVQAVPYAGGSADTALSSRATSINRKRVDELFAEVSKRLSQLAEEKLNREFLGSEEFFEILRSCAEAVSRAASEQKRKAVADFLAGTIKQARITDLTQQIAEDLKVLQPLHLQILAALPSDAGAGLSPINIPDEIKGMNFDVYAKGFSDLAGLGFIRFHSGGIGVTPGFGGTWVATGYVKIFKEAVLQTE